MSEAIHEYGEASGGAKVSKGYYAVKSDGRVVFMNPRATMKPGWRHATADEVKVAKAPPAAKPAPTPAPPPAPVQPATFLGRSNVPDDPPGAVREDSPRHPAARAKD